MGVAWRALWLSRLLVWVVGAGAVGVFGTSGRESGFDPQGLTEPFGSFGDALVAPFARWDSVWFLDIADGGYGDGSREAFFPLYPIVVKVLGAPFGEAGMLVMGAIASTGLLLIALTVLYRLVTLDFSPEVARTTVMVTAFGPMAFFFSAVYSESLFLAVSVGAIYAARTDRWAWAGALGALAASTRSAGVLLVLPLLMIYLWDTAWPRIRTMRRPRADILYIALVPLGLIAYCAALAIDGEDPLAPFQAQDVWFREFAGPFVGAWDGLDAGVQAVRQLWSGSHTHVYFTQAGGDPIVVAQHNLELAVWLLLAIPLVVGALKRLPAAYGAYVVTALALPLSYPVGPQPLMSLPRFLLVLFPLAVVLALWTEGHAWRRRVLLGVCGAALVVYTSIFSTWHWVA